MTTPQQQAIEALWVSQQVTSGVEVTYKQGTRSVTLTAVPGRAQIETYDGTGFTSSQRIADWIMKVTDLDGLLPKADDQILWEERKYSCIAVSGQVVFEYVGPHRTLVRVHTREVTRG